jgi:hypothetical protein
MCYPYLTNTAWQADHMSERDRRAADERLGRLFAGWTRRLRWPRTSGHRGVTVATPEAAR